MTRPNLAPTLSIALAGMLLLGSVSANALPPAAPVELIYNAGSQYTATLDQTRNLWRLLPINGQDVVISTGACATGAMIPTGVWLLVVDRHGRPELLAPSATRLPPGSPDRIALRACDQAHGRELAVPQTVLDLLAANTGAVYVRN